MDGSGATLAENVAENALQGERFVFTRSGRDTGGEVFAFDFYVSPGGGMPFNHRHTSQDEVFECVRGRLHLVINGQPRVLQAGETVRVPRGTAHSFCNPGTQEVLCRVEYRPAGRNEEWFRLVNAPVKRFGKAPGLLDLAPFILDMDLYAAGPPLWAQRVLFGWILAPLARLLGRRKRMLRTASEVYGRPFEW